MKNIKILGLLVLLLINSSVNSSDSNCIDINKYSNYNEMVFNARDLLKIITLEDYHVTELKDKEYEYNNDYNKLRIYLNSPKNKIKFAIKIQEDISSIHYKLANKIDISENENSLYTTLKNIVYNKSTDNDAQLLLDKYTNQINDDQIINSYADEYDFYKTFDLKENINNINLNITYDECNQLKLDIYKQLKTQVKKQEILSDKEKEENLLTLTPKFVTKYDQEYNAVYAYFINEKFLNNI